MRDTSHILRRGWRPLFASGRQFNLSVDEVNYKRKSAHQIQQRPKNETHFRFILEPFRVNCNLQSPFSGTIGEAFILAHFELLIQVLHNFQRHAHDDQQTGAAN